MLNRGRGDGDLGDGFLLKRGFTIIWVGWQADLAGTGDEVLRLRAPVAATAAAAILGWVRVERTPAANVAALPIADANHVAYPIVDPASTHHVLRCTEPRPAQIVRARGEIRPERRRAT
jgi:hypothetical protein